ncbi:Serine/threonine-protein kinase/endoribonuclease IRE1 [Nymphon striatum]|nr:Serine/threonine-protein kinase/endoribonuclease IRE1 [Nymphon striatum]
MLGDAIWTLLTHDAPGIIGQVHYVFDGGALVQRIPWARGSTYKGICRQYTDFNFDSVTVLKIVVKETHKVIDSSSFRRFTINSEALRPHVEQTGEHMHSGKQATVVPLVVQDSTIVVSTLNGFLYGINAATGARKWVIKNDPVLKFAHEDSRGSYYLPDPTDGSLYLFVHSKNQYSLKKVSSNIRELVYKSPIRNADGILYTGRKIDVWYAINAETGVVQETLSMSDEDKFCPTSPHAVYIGRTEYQIIIFDSKSKQKRLNFTFYDYSANVASDSFETYGYSHFTSSSNGRAVTVDRNTGEILWNQDFGSPVVNIYSLNQDGLSKIPFVTMARDVITDMPTLLSKWFTKSVKTRHLFRTLYIGEYDHGYYALSSLVDQKAVSALTENYLQIDGPKEEKSEKDNLNLGKVQMLPDKDASNKPKLKAGFLALPDNAPKLISHQREIYSEKSNIIDFMIPPPPRHKSSLNEIDNKLFQNVHHKELDACVDNNENCDGETSKLLLLIINVLRFNHMNETISLEFQHYGINNRLKVWDSVGRIRFKTKEILGYGSQGTIVYKGVFDNRNVAVKRILRECYQVFDREVALLRESDDHPNVIRYFCVEFNSYFNFIALELCSATIAQYVTDSSFDKRNLDSITALYQAAKGLSHLHSLNIVHRDLNSHNVLISMPNSQGEIRVLISDFGLSKKLGIGKNSFSKQSGPSGTEGWIAPEMLAGTEERPTVAVDLFSYGILIYFVLSNGEHPFGKEIYRQSNISDSKFDLSALSNPNVVIARLLIEQLLLNNPKKRPGIETVLNYPLFWSKAEQLSFIMDVSDKVEKLAPDDPIIINLEKGRFCVYQNKWTDSLSPDLCKDLRSSRSYQNNIRGLLRAIRNKKNHYREINAEVKEALGSLPDGFLDYFTSRFPHLLIHTYNSLQMNPIHETVKCAVNENLGNGVDSEFVTCSHALHSLRSSPSLSDNIFGKLESEH